LLVVRYLQYFRKKAKSMTSAEGAGDARDAIASSSKIFWAKSIRFG